ncbi:hypothetical protein [Flindersiella endophytica]
MGQAYVLLALVRMYETTKDTVYLDHLIRNADTVLAQRDQERGVADYRGVSGPVWRATGDYSAAIATLKDATGKPLLQVRTAQPSVNNRATVEVRQTGGTTQTSPFTLVFRGADGSAVTASDLNFNTASPRYVFKYVYNNVYNQTTRWSVRDVRPDHSNAIGLPVAGTTRLQPAPFVWAVHTGHILYPLASFVRLVYLDAALRANPTYSAKADEYLEAAEAGLDFHEREYWINDRGFGAYKLLKGSPVPCDGSNEPHNHINAMAMTMAELYRATGSATWGQRVIQIKNHLRYSMTFVNDAYRWPYWPVLSAAYNGWTQTGYTAQDISSFTQTYSPARQAEDLSHAALNLEFMTAAYRTGLAGTFTLTDMQRVSRTYTLNLINGATGAHLKVDGTGTAPASYLQQIPRWIPAAFWNTGVFTHALAVTRAQALQPVMGSVVAGFAYCVWAANGYGRG